MEQATTIEIRQQKHPRTEFVMEHRGSVYLAKGETNQERYKDALEYEEYNGGQIFWEKCHDGTMIYRVFPPYFKDFLGTVYTMEER